MEQKEELIKKYSDAMDLLIDSAPSTPEEILKTVAKEFETITIESLYAIITYSFGIGQILSAAYISKMMQEQKKKEEEKKERDRTRYIG